MGVFDSEKFWRDNNAASLPAIFDSSSANIINAMDELLFPFCAENGVLITGKKMNNFHKNYLNQIGFAFTCNSENLDDYAENSGGVKNNIFEAAALKSNFSKIEKLIDADTYLSPYAVIPYTLEMCYTQKIKYSLPELKHVKAVNSKIYSNTLKAKLGLNSVGEVVYDCGQLVGKGLEMLKNGAFLIKDEYGVSGKGNILITSEKLLLRIAGYLKKQEDSQMHIRFVLEPLLDKQLDFSCNIISTADGNIYIDSVQKIININFNYAGTCSIGEELYGFLEEKGYFKTMEKIAGELYKDGYFGEIGIDSMMLKDGNIVPIIEINARKTMGMVHQRINIYLKNFGLEGQLTFYSLGYTHTFKFEQLLSKMKEYKILFDPEAEKGIIPLSANTLLINSYVADNNTGGQEIFKGRFYYFAVAKTEEERAELILKTCELFKSSGFKIY